MLDTLYLQLGLLPMVIVGIFAFWKGDQPERITMGAYLLGWLAGVLIQDDGDLHQHWEWGLFLLDLGMLVVFGGVVWRSRRTWAAWAAALQLVTVLSHLVFLSDFRLSAGAFYTVLNLASYGVLFAIAIGTFWAWQERRAAGLE